MRASAGAAGAALDGVLGLAGGAAAWGALTGALSVEALLLGQFGLGGALAAATPFGGGAPMLARGGLVALLGPLGALALAVAATGALGARRAPQAAVAPAPLPAASAEALYAAILQNRRPRPDPERLEPLAQVFDAGTATERQAAIEAIARCLRPRMAPALRAAAASDDPSIRVQAAALLARLRETAPEPTMSGAAATCSADAAAEPKRARAPRRRHACGGVA